MRTGNDIDQAETLAAPLQVANEIARSVPEALERLKGSEYDAVVALFPMPDWPPEELLEEIPMARVDVDDVDGFAEKCLTILDTPGLREDLGTKGAQRVRQLFTVEGRPFVMEAGAKCVAQFEVRPEHWYFASNRQDQIPFAVLLEIALQPCG